MEFTYRCFDRVSSVLDLLELISKIGQDIVFIANRGGPASLLVLQRAHAIKVP